MEESIIKYRNAVSTIKQAILQSQYRAAKLVTGEQLSLYFGIGGYVSANSREGTWGTGAIDRISEQLRRELPGLRGFSASSIKDMRAFYEYWCQYITQILKVDINIIDMPELSKSCTGNTLEKQLITALVLEIFAFFCEQERESIKKRQREGINAAKRKGVKFGRHEKPMPDNFIEVATRWKNAEITARAAMNELNLSKNLFYKFIKQIGCKKGE